MPKDESHQPAYDANPRALDGPIRLETESTIQAFHQAGLSDHAYYFEQHQRRMHYLEFQEDGHPIGSGSVESACKQFQDRPKGPGMRWSRLGADRMLVVRAAVLSNSFDDLWRAA